MNKIIFTVIAIFFLKACSYEPILLNKKYDFQLNDITATGDKEINRVLIDKLKNKTNGSKIFNLNLISKKKEKILSYDGKGDPLILELKISLNYEILLNEKVILKDKIQKQITYNNIKDKYELAKYEDLMILNLSENLSDEILVSIATVQNDS